MGSDVNNSNGLMTMFHLHVLFLFPKPPYVSISWSLPFFFHFPHHLPLPLHHLLSLYMSTPWHYVLPLYSFLPSLNLSSHHSLISLLILYHSRLLFLLPPSFRSLLQPSIEKNLSEFQQKRLMGLGWMFGDQKLSDTMAPDEVADAVYTTLLPHIKDIMWDCCHGNTAY